MKTVLIIDDDPEMRETLAHYLESPEYDVILAACPHEAFEILQKGPVDAVVCDLHMPFMNGPQSDEFLHSFEVGIKTIAELRWVFPELEIIAISAAPYRDLIKITREIREVPILTKPFSARSLRGALNGDGAERNGSAQ